LLLILLLNGIIARIGIGTGGTNTDRDNERSNR